MDKIKRHPVRKSLRHDPPPWVVNDSIFFITICSLPRGKNQLCIEPLSSRLLTSATNVHERGSWWLLMMLLMPDHVHMLAAFPDGNGPAPAVRNWKRFAARHFGVKWQRDFFDHRIRHDESLEGKESNIRLNPVRAGLVDRPEDWPHIITPGWNFR